MLKLYNIRFKFYPREVVKIEARIEPFQKVKQKWENKATVNNELTNSKYVMLETSKSSRVQ